jgi:hypothetical protein
MTFSLCDNACAHSHPRPHFSLHWVQNMACMVRKIDIDDNGYKNAKMVGWRNAMFSVRCTHTYFDIELSSLEC